MNGIVNEIGGAMLQQPAMLAGIRSRAESAWRKHLSEATGGM